MIDGLTTLESNTLHYILHVVQEHLVRDEAQPGYYIDDGGVLLRFTEQEKRALKRMYEKL